MKWKGSRISIRGRNIDILLFECCRHWWLEILRSDATFPNVVSLWHLDEYVGVQCRVYILNTEKILSGIPVMHPGLPSPLPSEYLAFPNHFVVPTHPPTWIICLLYWKHSHVPVCPSESFPKELSRPEHLYSCSTHINLCLVHPYGAQSKPFNYGLIIYFSDISTFFPRI